jgi:hypothetical protein
MNSGTSRRISTITVAIISLFSLTGVLKAIERTASVEGIVTEIESSQSQSAQKPQGQVNNSISLSRTSYLSLNYFASHLCWGSFWQLR